MSPQQADGFFYQSDMKIREKGKFFVNRSVPENFQWENFLGQVPTESLRTQNSENVYERWVQQIFDPVSVARSWVSATKWGLLAKLLSPCLASISPKNPAYASKQWSKKSSGIYISSNDSEHNQYQKRCHRNMYRVTYRKDSCMKGFGKC